MAGRDPNSVIRTLYLYLFSLIGLVLVTIGAAGFLNMGLRAFVFTEADSVDRFTREMPPRVRPIEETRKLLSVDDLSEQERARLREMLNDLEDWERRREKVDYVAARRHREAAENLALILIGLPLYLYHWCTIQRRTAGEDV